MSTRTTIAILLLGVSASPLVAGDSAELRELAGQTGRFRLKSRTRST